MTTFLHLDFAASQAPAKEVVLSIASFRYSAPVAVSFEITMKDRSKAIHRGNSRSRVADLNEAGGQLLPLEPMILSEEASTEFRARMEDSSTSNPKLQAMVDRARAARG